VSSMSADELSAGLSVSFEQVGTLIERLHGSARRYRVKEMSRFGGRASEAAVPASLTLLLADERAGRHSSRLFVGEHEIDASDWQLEQESGTLSWRGRAGAVLHSGHVQLLPGNLRGLGHMSVDGVELSAEIELAPVSYTCAVSANAGAYVTGGVDSPKLRWDTSSPQWQHARWVPALRFSYDVKDRLFIGQPDPYIEVTFKDLETQVEWQPNATADEFSALLNADLEFTFTLDPSLTTPPDDRSGLPAPANEIATVMGSIVAFDFDGFAATLQGALLTGQETIRGVAYALNGTADDAAVVGVYELELADGSQAQIAIRDGRLLVDGTLVERSAVQGASLTWEGLAPGAALPESGSIEFARGGEHIESGTGVRAGRRLAAAELSTRALSAQALPQGPNANDLLSMTQFIKDPKSEKWGDAFQLQAMGDFYDILQYHMDPSLRSKFVSAAPPQLDPIVTSIASTPGADGANAATWYRTLSIPYLVNALSMSSMDAYAKRLNADRARTWMKSEVARASVYQAQAPLLYRNRWIKQWPETATFIADQANNQATYNPMIDQDYLAWKAQIEATVPDATQRQEVMKAVDAAVAAGKQGMYWAYWLFRKATQPADLMLLKAISISGTAADGTAYTRRVQTTCALLNVLDPSGTFVHEYVSVIELFQVGNVLPTLLDYSANPDEFTYAVTEILEAFIAQYVNGSDPQLRQAAHELQAAIQAKQVANIVQALAGLAESFSGIYGWEQLAALFEAKLPKIVNVGFVGAAKMIAVGITCAGIFGFVFGIKDWRELKGEERAAVIAGGVAAFVQIASPLIRRGAALAGLFSADSLNVSSLWGVLKGTNLADAEARLTNGFSRWLVNTGRRPVVESEMFGNLFQEEEDLTLAERALGRNLDEFVATRLGAMFAVVNIVLSAIALANSEDDYETAENSLFLAAGTLELFAAAGDIAISLGLETIGMFEICAVIPGLQVLAVAAAIAGVVLMIVEMNRKPPDPIGEFAAHQAATVGMYMPDDAAIDSFQVYQVPGQPQRLGVGLEWAGQDSSWLRMNPDGTTALGLNTADYRTAFYMEVDAQGFVRLSTLAAGTGTGQHPIVLTADENPAVRALAPITDPKLAGHQQWVSEMSDNVRFDNEHPLSATFAFYNRYWFEHGGKKLYLAEVGGAVGLTEKPAHPWTLTMLTMNPGQLSVADWTLYTYQRDQRLMPFLGQPGSVPRTWSIDPTVPSWLSFDTASGAIAQQPGQAPPASGPQRYTVSVAGTTTITSNPFVIQVLDAPASAI
jgi:hypothetical protein